MLRLLRELGGFSSRFLASCPSKLSSCRCSDKDQFSLKAYAADEQEVLADDEDLADQDAGAAAAAEDRLDGNYASSQTNIPRTIIVHNSPPKAAWDWLILLLVVYVAVMTPYLAAFRTVSKAPPPPPADGGFRNESKSESSSFVVHLLSDRLILIDFIVDITFLVDMVVNFRTTYLRNGELVANPRKIAINYLRGWFLIDAVSAIPFDVILSIVRTSDTMTATGLLKTPRLLRLLRVARRIDQYSEYGASVLLLLMASFTLIAHWLACIFYAIAHYERKYLEPTIGFLNRLNVSGSTFEHYDPTGGPDIRSRYISSLYFTFTILTSVGFGNISPETNNEKVFSIFAMMLGSLMSAAVFGNVSSIMLRLYQGTEDYHEKTTRVKEFIKFHRIPGPLARRLLDSNQRTWWETSGVDMAGVLRSFPDGLQADICLHLNRTLLNKCPAFHNASPGFLRALSMKLKTVHIPPGDAIVHQGDQLPAIYFVGKGTIEISRDNIVCAILGTNDVFGEDLRSALLEPRVGFCRSGYLVRALSYCDLHKISLTELLEIVSLFAEFSSVFRQKFQVTFDLGTPSNVSRDPSKARLSYLLTEKGAISSDEDDRHLPQRPKLEHCDRIALLNRSIRPLFT